MQQLLTAFPTLLPIKGNSAAQPKTYIVPLSLLGISHKKKPPLPFVCYIDWERELFSRRITDSFSIGPRGKREYPSAWSLVACLTSPSRNIHPHKGIYCHNDGAAISDSDGRITEQLNVTMYIGLSPMFSHHLSCMHFSNFKMATRK